MPGFIPSANTVRVALRFLVSGNEAFNVINVLCPAPANAAALAAIAAVFQAWWTNEYRPIVSAACVWTGATLTALDAPGSPFLAYVNSGTPNGGIGGVSLPLQVTVAVSFGTGLSGRSYRGRAYMVGLSSALDQTGGIIASGPIAAIVACWDALRTRLITAGYHLCVASFYSGIDSNGDKIPRAAAVTSIVTAVTVHQRIDTQRRRLPRES